MVDIIIILDIIGIGFDWNLLVIEYKKMFDSVIDNNIHYTNKIKYKLPKKPT